MFHIMLIKIECIKGDYGVYEEKDIEKKDGTKGKNSPGRQDAGEKMNILNLRDLKGKDVAFING